MRLLDPEGLLDLVEVIAFDGHCADIADIAADELIHLSPPERISTVECAERFRKVRPAEGSTAIPYDRWRNPFNVAKMNALDNPACNLVVVVKPSRSGGTTVAENYLFRMIKFGPMGDVGWYLGSNEAVKQYCDRIVQPMFDDHADLAARIGSGRSDNNDTSKKIGGHLVEWLSANDGNFRNREFLFAVMDEPDGWTAKKYAESPKTQLEGRQKQIGRRRKGMIMSHPDKGWAAGVAPAWESTSRGIYIMRCPECRHYAAAHATKFWPDVPEFRLAYQRNPEASQDERLAMAEQTAGMVCPHCGSVLNDEQRFAMIDEASTRPGDGYMHRGQTLDPVAGIVGEMAPTSEWGFWDHGLMLKVSTAAELAKALEEALIKHERSGKRKTNELREVMSKLLGEIFEGKAGLEGVNAAVLQKRARAESVLSIGECPAQGLFITAAVDVGGGKFDVSFRAWDLEARSWWLDRLTLRQRRWADGRMRDIRPRERIEDWDILIDEVILRTFPIIGRPGWAMPVAAVAIDVGDGNTTWKGREFARRTLVAGHYWGSSAKPWSRVRLIQGSPSAKAPALGKPRIISRDEHGKQIEPVVLEYTLGVHELKELAIERLAINDGGPGQCLFADGIASNYFEEYFNERLIDGKWERNGPNESLDCFDELTEVLTDQGWKQFPDLRGDEKIATVNLLNQTIEYQNATKHIARRHIGEMVEIKGRRIDILVTPNHRMVTFKKRYISAEKRWNFDVPPQITLAKDLTLHHQLMVAADWHGDAVETIEIPAVNIEGRNAVTSKAAHVDAGDLAEFLGWFVAEGGASCYRSKTQGNVRRRVGIYQKPSATADAIRDCLSRLPWRFSERNVNGCIHFVCASKQLYEYITANCGHGAETKRVPDWVRFAPADVIRRFVDAAIAGDGWHQTKPGQRLHRTYATISRELADGMQELFLKLGCAANIKARAGKTCEISSQPDRVGKTQYYISELKRRKASLDGGGGGSRKYIGRTVDFEGMVYCVSVPNGTLICRRNGKSFIAGNCFGYEEAVRLMLDPDRKDINWNGQRLPPWATPVPVSVGGGDLSAEAKVAAAEAPSQPRRQSIFERFDALNNGS